ncbi:lasso peptide biosynthesis B2 protein [Aurantiacibacter poecillastricola]|uniref:lasso peptide biosynthesis B2 protein n=1 Tax=Aurantiacibacter poecillastricola TaxID=3064385 RepID=UPI00273F0053|nr:lasso peptide biosynthesis B2 protein [Aurantiacibacter sp. 219JJ12-13]MDP5263229.1 lasso peptide biosynthesis B2 protein [Aurantiacibacter sp. 219JJ12-13]
MLAWPTVISNAGAPGRIAHVATELRACLIAFFVIAAVRLLLSLKGYGWLRQRLPAAGPAAPSRHYARAVARRVRRLAPAIPGATCLTQAVSAQYILARSGHPVRIIIGVRGANREFGAHAWLVCEDEILLGGGPGDYTCITELT